MNTSNLIHICIKSEVEVMHREEDDYRCGISKMALAASRTGTIIYAFAFMSTHIHIVAETRDVSRFVSNFKNAYTRWFNHKYCRTGSLGEKSCHIEYLDNLNRALRAINYVLRNPVHHLVCDTALGYEFCSARYVFQDTICRGDSAVSRRTSRYYPSRRPLPKNMYLNEQGMISPECFLDTAAVERIYISPKKFLFHINSSSFRDLVEDGEKPLSIGDVEPGVNLEELRKNEMERSVKGNTTDIDVCRIIDKEILTDRTYAQLSLPERKDIARRLARRPDILSQKQICRCLGLVMPTQERS